MKCEITYWDKPGRKNTAGTIAHAVQRARQLGIRHAVIATCTGYSAKVLLRKAPGMSIIAVSHQAGFAKPGGQEMSPKVRDFLTRSGVSVFTATHFFGGFDRAIRFKFGGLEPGEIAANVLRIFCEGVKVAVEVAVMALDAGLIPYDREIIALGGTGEGVDTALVCRPQHGKDFFNFEVREIICKPRIP
jgi:hypothetical protein